jgi:hypothetical protein
MGGFFQTEGVPSVKSYYAMVGGGSGKLPERVRLPGLQGFDAKDAQAGLLRWYYPQTTMWWYMVDRFMNEPGHLSLLTIRDFFNFQLAIKPDADLRKYTPPQMPPVIAKWREEQIQILRLQQAEMLADQERRALEEKRDNLSYTVGGALKSIAGVDHLLLSETKTHCLFRLLSKRALVMEAIAQNNCIDGGSYIKELQSPNKLFLSIRKKDKPDVPIVTIEANILPAQQLQVVQFEGRDNTQFKLASPERSVWNVLLLGMQWELTGLISLLGRPNL